MISGGRIKLIITIAAIVGGGFLTKHYFASRPSAVDGQGVSSETSNLSRSSGATGAARSTPVASPSPAEIKERERQQWLTLFQTPISVYGKVIDEKGGPIPIATVEI